MPAQLWWNLPEFQTQFLQLRSRTATTGTSASAPALGMQRGAPSEGCSEQGRPRGHHSAASTVRCSPASSAPRLLVILK